jgi:hypothetical protein
MSGLYWRIPGPEDDDEPQQVPPAWDMHQFAIGDAPWSPGTWASGFHRVGDDNPYDFRYARPHRPPQVGPNIIPQDSTWESDVEHVTTSLTVLYPEHLPLGNNAIQLARNNINNFQASEAVAINDIAREVLLNFRIREHNTGVLYPARHLEGRRLRNHSFWVEDDVDEDIDHLIPEERILLLMFESATVASQNGYWVMLPMITPLEDGSVMMERAFDNYALRFQRFLKRIYNEDLWQGMNQMPEAVILGRFLHSVLRGLLIFKRVRNQQN